MRVYIPCAAARLRFWLWFIRLSAVHSRRARLFTAALCVSLPVGILTSVYFPMLRAAKRALRHGAMIVGWRAAEEFGECTPLLWTREVFPSESVLLHGIKTFPAPALTRQSRCRGGFDCHRRPTVKRVPPGHSNRTDILKEVTPSYMSRIWVFLAGSEAEGCLSATAAA